MTVVLVADALMTELTPVDELLLAPAFWLPPPTCVMTVVFDDPALMTEFTVVDALLFTVAFWLPPHPPPHPPHHHQPHPPPHPPPQLELELLLDEEDELEELDEEDVLLLDELDDEEELELELELDVLDELPPHHGKPQPGKQAACEELEETDEDEHPWKQNGNGKACAVTACDKNRLMLTATPVVYARKRI